MGCSSSSFSEISDESTYGLYKAHPLSPRKLNFENSRTTSTDETYYAKPEQRGRTTSSTKLLKRSPAFRKPDRKFVPKTLNNQMKANQETSQKQQQTEHSYGYCSGSTDDDLDDSWSTFSCNSMLLRTQDISDSSIRSSNAPQCDEPVSNLKMEILMMRENLAIMPNTSSPIFKRRGLSFTNYIGYTPPTGTYCRWRKHLHEKFSYSYRYITNLPEAITGQFSSTPHPTNICKGDCECMSAPKHHHVASPKKQDHSALSEPLAVVVPAYGVVQPIESTEL